MEEQGDKEKEKREIGTAIPLVGGANPTYWWEIDEQIEWIAKGLVFSARDHSLRHEIWNNCNNG